MRDHDARQREVPPDETAAQPLGRADWIEAALVLLAAEGVEAVRITRLAERLGVTRGSFYWHFKHRDDLLAALIKAWEKRNTGAMIEAIADKDDLIDAVLALFELWMADEPFAPRLDAAMRDWARRSDKVSRTVERADNKRLKAIARAFEAAGFEPTEAFIRARILYFTQVGYYALDVHETLAKRTSYAAAYIKGFTGLELDPERAARNRRHLLQMRRSAQEKSSI